MPEKIIYQIDVEPGDSAKTLGQLENELAQINEELKDVPLNSKAFDDLTKQSQELTRELDKTNLAIQGVTDEDRIRGFQGSVDIVAGSIAGLTGAIGLLGLESEEFEKYTAYAANAIALAEGMRLAAQGAVDLRETLKKATVAQRAFNIATLANPYVAGGAAIVATIGAIASKFDTFTRAIGDAGINTEIFTKFVNNFSDIVSGAANVIAFKAGRLVAGFIHLFNFDLKQAGSAFGEFCSVMNIPTLFTEGFVSSQVARFTAKGKADAEAYVDGLEEGTREQVQALETTIQPAGVDLEPLEQAKITVQAIDEVVAAQMRADAANKAQAASAMEAATLEEKRRETLEQSAIALETLGNILGQETAAGKALAVSAALINTYLAATKALNEVPFPFNIVAAAAVIGNGIASVKRITSTPVPGAPSSAGVSTSAMAPPAPPMANNIGISPETVAEQQTVRAYVVAGDVTTTQEAEAKLNAKRSLGRTGF